MSQNLQVHRGDSASFAITVTQAGAAYSLTGSIMRFTAKWSYYDADNAAVISRTSVGGTNGIVYTGTGTATLTLAPANTSSLPGAQVNLYYDLQVTDATGNVYTLLDGILTVLPDVTITTS